jgi:protein associated with RNAse G/E
VTASNDDRPEPGTRLSFRWRKWDGGVHWVHDCIYLGSDQWGDWFGQHPGQGSSRPGRTFTATHPNVTLLPPSGDYAYTHNAPPHRTRVYIDIAWDVRWRDGEPTGIDMDLDVVDREDGGVYIDDRDEWDEHRIAYGYPAEVVTELDALAYELERQVAAHTAPFDLDTGERWIARLAEFPRPRLGK